MGEMLFPRRHPGAGGAQSSREKIQKGPPLRLPQLPRKRGGFRGGKTVKGGRGKSGDCSACPSVGDRNYRKGWRVEPLSPAPRKRRQGRLRGTKDAKWRASVLQARLRRSRRDWINRMQLKGRFKSPAESLGGSA